LCRVIDGAERQRFRPGILIGSSRMFLTDVVRFRVASLITPTEEWLTVRQDGLRRNGLVIDFCGAKYSAEDGKHKNEKPHRVCLIPFWAGGFGRPRSGSEIQPRADLNHAVTRHPGDLTEGGAGHGGIDTAQIVPIESIQKLAA